MDANEIAWNNQRNATPVDWSLLGVKGLTAPKREIAEGQIPSFWSPLVRSQIGYMQLHGHDIKVWIGWGIFTRDFAVKGTPHAVAAFKRWFDGVCGKD